MPEQAVEQGMVAVTAAPNDNHDQSAPGQAREILSDSRWHSLANHHWLKRRDFLLLSAGTAIASKSAVTAAGIPRVGFIGSGFREPNEALLDSFLDGLDEFGWTKDNLLVLDRWAEEHTERLPRIASELVASDVDLLVTVGTPATLAARRVTTEVPIVLVGVGDPVGLGVVNSLAHPGGNTTGLSLSSHELIVTRLQLLQELIPGLRCVAVIARNDPGLEQRLLDIRTNAERMGLRVIEFVTATGKAIELAFRWLTSDRCDALYVASGPLGPAKRAEIIALAAGSRVPAIYSSPVFAAAGGLITFSADERVLFRRAAAFVDKILKGTRAAELPIEEPSKFELVINIRTAKALGLVVPPSLLARADSVIE